MESSVVLSKIKDGVYSHIRRFLTNTKIQSIGIDGLISKLRSYSLDGAIDNVYYKYNNRHLISPQFVADFTTMISDNKFLYDCKNKTIPMADLKYIFAINTPSFTFCSTYFMRMPNLKYVKGAEGSVITPKSGVDTFHETKNIVSLDIDIDCTNCNLPKSTRLTANVFSKLVYTRLNNVSFTLDFPSYYPSMCKESIVYAIEHIHDYGEGYEGETKELVLPSSMSSYMEEDCPQGSIVTYQGEKYDDAVYYHYDSEDDEAWMCKYWLLKSEDEGGFGYTEEDVSQMETRPMTNEELLGCRGWSVNY